MTQKGSKTPWEQILEEFFRLLRANDAVDDQAIERLGQLAKTEKIGNYQSVRDALWPPDKTQP